MNLIINADDFGMTKSCTQAIFNAFQQNLITDTTMVANGSAFDLAVSLTKNNPIKDHIGIHFNLTEGTPLTEKIKTCPNFTENGLSHDKINRLKPLSQFEKQAVYEELTAQVEKILAAGIDLTHADSHHHIHTAVFIAPIVLKVCQTYGINKIRIHRNIGKISGFKMFVKRMYNDWLKRKGFIVTEWMGSLEDVTLKLPKGCTEIMVHPDFDTEGKLIDRIETDGEYAVGEDLQHLPKLTKENRWAYRLLSSEK